MLVEDLQNQIRGVKEKLALRESLLEKKEVAAKQFFDLTYQELKRLEEEFWEKFKTDTEEEKELI